LLPEKSGIGDFPSDWALTTAEVMTAQISTAAAALNAVAGLGKVIFMSILPPERGCYSVWPKSGFCQNAARIQGRRDGSASGVKSPSTQLSPVCVTWMNCSLEQTTSGPWMTWVQGLTDSIGQTVRNLFCQTFPSRM
jgi:hypothetical protein